MIVRGFTLVELLVSMAVLVLIIGLLARLVDSTSLSILGSTKGMDNNQLSTVALDRIGNSIAGMVTSGAATLVAYKNPEGSDGLAMLSNNRVRSRTGGDANINVNSFTSIRMGARGFGVLTLPDLEMSSSPTIPMLCWGDGTVTWQTGNGGASVKGEQADPSKALSLAAHDLVTPPTGNSTAGSMLNFTPLSRSIFRFELAFLLSDGTTVSGSGADLPHLASLSGGGSAPLPRNKYFVPGEELAGTPPATFPSRAYPLALNAVTSDVAANNNSNGLNVYVRAVIVGIVSIDATTQKILTGVQMTQLADLKIFGKSEDGKTPTQKWNLADPGGESYPKIAAPNFPAAVLKNVRATQRYYYVN